MARKLILKRFGFTALAAIIVARFSRWLNSPYRSIDPAGIQRDHLWTGIYGERVAADWLRARRIKILAKNFKAPGGGEVDIVAREGRLLLFIEVKTRRTDARVRGYGAVDREKRKLIERGANHWLRLLRTRKLPWRFDVIEVRVEEGKPPAINHIRDAF